MGKVHCVASGVSEESAQGCGVSELREWAVVGECGDLYFENFGQAVQAWSQNRNCTIVHLSGAPPTSAWALFQ